MQPMTRPQRQPFFVMLGFFKTVFPKIAKMVSNNVETFSFSKTKKHRWANPGYVNAGVGVCAELIMAQAEPSIRDRLNQIDSEIDSSLRRKLRKINTKFPDVSDGLVLGSDGRVRRVPKAAETKVKE
jgi:hypothetical protein